MRNIDELQKEVKELQEITNPEDIVLASTAIFALAHLAGALSGVIKKSISDTFQRAKEEHEIGNAVTKETTKESLIQKVSDDIAKFLKTYSETQKIISTGSFNYKDSSAQKIRSEIDKSLTKFNFSPDDKNKIETLVLQKITS